MDAKSKGNNFSAKAEAAVSRQFRYAIITYRAFAVNKFKGFLAPKCQTGYEILLAVDVH
jgi:hypothetical protein